MKLDFIVIKGDFNGIYPLVNLKLLKMAQSK